jgi:peptidyl-prolyl cis-trans isomerase C
LIPVKLPACRGGENTPLFQNGLFAMTIIINGVAISRERIEAEAAHHKDCASPTHAAACALAIRELLLQRAREAGIAEDIGAADDSAIDTAIERLLAREVPVPAPTETECRRHYERQIERFTVGELVEGAHILFAVTANAPLQAIRTQAEATLRQALKEPQRFGELAQRLSNCPSAAQGGNLGQIQRGDTVPEFERALFSASEGVLPQLVKTRYGFHIVRIERRIAGRRLPFEAVQAQIAQTLTETVRTTAAEQYVRILASRASMSGIDLGAAASPLVQ